MNRFHQEEEEKVNYGKVKLQKLEQNAFTVYEREERHQ